MHDNDDTAYLNRKDFDLIKSHAIKNYINKGFPKYVGDRRVKIEGTEGNVLALIEETISYLYSEGHLKRKVKFDYRED